MPRPAIDNDSRCYRYYRNAVERHWDPHEIDVEGDVEPLIETDEASFDNLRQTLALFGAGEEAVTDDLAPLAVVLDDAAEQQFVTTQLYEEAKHADFFDRYWRTVINQVERERGLAETSPSADRWFIPEYDELFERNEEAMSRLLTADTPENRALAYCHYHLTIEGIMAQTGYDGVQSSFDGGSKRFPQLDGLVEGFSKIRSDEGRHVGFGMAQLKALVADNEVEVELLHETTEELVELAQEIIAEVSSGVVATPSTRVKSYTARKHTERLEQIVDASKDLPDVETLVRAE